ncbi:HAD family phosphatase [Akkermansiaceae bacterium]|nr:HAD family phosphatase [Akkermansiaceae bacterium]
MPDLGRSLGNLARWLCCARHIFRNLRKSSRKLTSSSPAVVMSQRIIEYPEEGFEGLIFDLDGTLIDSMPAHFAAMRQALEEEGGKGLFTKERFSELGGKPATDIVALLNRENGLSMNAQKVCQRQHEILESNLGHFEVIPEVANYAAKYRGKVPMAVASAGTNRMVKASLKSVDMLLWFDAIVGSDEVENGKPSPDVYLEAARRINVDPTNCVVFEDSEAGVLAAKSAGMKVVVVPTQA